MERSEKWTARNARIAKFAASISVRQDDPAYTPFFDAYKELKANDKDHEKKIDELVELSLALVEVFYLNGPGLYLDTYLRIFLREYNERIIKGEGANQPTWFNVIRSFVEPVEQNLILRLLPEKIYSISFSRMLDYITSPNSNLNLQALIEKTEELTVYELNMFGGYTDFRLPGHDDYIFCGAAFVREQDEISIMSVFGRNLVRNNNPPTLVVEANPEKKVLTSERSTINTGKSSLFGDENFQPVILLSRIHLPESKIQARYVLDERKEVFRVWTDDPAVIEAIKDKNENKNEAIEKMLSQIAAYSEMFNFISMIPCFIFALDLLEDDIVIERHPTALKSSQLSTNIRKIKSKVGPADAQNYVEVRTLAGIGNDSSYILPESGLSIDLSGYWRTLQLGALGADKHGRSVQGKTWVNKQESWFEIRNTYSMLLGKPVKVDIGSAIEEISGFVYVMRSANHPKDVYKIGFTVKNPDERAAQLSSTSGQPDMFNVVQAWRVKNPREIEHHVHSLLKEYRINPSREFFKLKYREIRACIERVIDNADAMLDE